MNLCSPCGRDFASVGAFDRHRVGRHAYSFTQGLQLEPPREDGRRCLDLEEMSARGFERDRRGRWRDPKSIRGVLAKGAYSLSDATGPLGRTPGRVAA